MTATNSLRIVIADDERPARSFLAALLRSFDDVEIVGEAATGTEAVDVIERQHPDLALLDLEMPELDGIGVVQLLRRDRMPLIAFVTAHDEYAVRAFELNVVDYLLKPVDRSRLRETLARARDRLDHTELRDEAASHVRQAAADIEAARSPPFLSRIPVRRPEGIIILPVAQVAAIVADGEALRITTTRGEQHMIGSRLKDIEPRLDPRRFMRLGRGTIVSIDSIVRINPMPGGTYAVTLSNGQELPVSRAQSRALRARLLQL